MRGVVILTAVAAAVAAFDPSLALASRAPTAPERVVLIRVARTYVDTSDCCAVIAGIKVESIRVSTVDRRRAHVRIEGFNQSGVSIGPA